MKRERLNHLRQHPEDATGWETWECWLFLAFSSLPAVKLILDFTAQLLKEIAG